MDKVVAVARRRERGMDSLATLLLLLLLLLLLSLLRFFLRHCAFPGPEQISQFVRKAEVFVPVVDTKICSAACGSNSFPRLCSLR